MEKADFIVESHGSIFLFQPLNPPAAQHLRESVDDNAQWLGTALAVEPRYALDLAAGLTNDGFIVR